MAILFFDVDNGSLEADGITPAVETISVYTGPRPAGLSEAIVSVSDPWDNPPGDWVSLADLAADFTHCDDAVVSPGFQRLSFTVPDTARNFLVVSKRWVDGEDLGPNDYPFVDIHIEVDAPNAVEVPELVHSLGTLTIESEAAYWEAGIHEARHYYEVDTVAELDVLPPGADEGAGQPPSYGGNRSTILYGYATVPNIYYGSQNWLCFAFADAGVAQTEDVEIEIEFPEFSPPPLHLPRRGEFDKNPEDSHRANLRALEHWAATLNDDTAFIWPSDWEVSEEREEQAPTPEYEEE